MRRLAALALLLGSLGCATVETKPAPAPPAKPKYGPCKEPLVGSSARYRACFQIDHRTQANLEGRWEDSRDSGAR